MSRRYRYIDMGKDSEIWMYCLHYVSMQSSIYLCKCMNRYIHTYPYKYMRCTTHKCIYLFLKLLRLSLSLLRSFSISPALLLFRFLALSLCRLSLSLSRSLAVLLSRSLFLALLLSRFRSRLSRIHKHALLANFMSLSSSPSSLSLSDSLSKSAGITDDSKTRRVYL